MSSRSSDKNSNRHYGPVMMSAFELIAMGLGYNFEQYESAGHMMAQDKIVELARSIWSDPNFTNNSGSGVGVSTRIRANLPLGRTLFAP